MFLKEKLIKVLGKGSKERYVPLGAQLTLYMLCYTPGEVYFLRNRKGEPITESVLRNLFRKMQKAIGIRIYPHNLRHNFATNFMLHELSNGTDGLYKLSSIMGHSSIEITRVYLHLAQQLVALSNPYSHFDAILCRDTKM